MKWLKLFENFNEKKFIWIHGLPGSGKSFLAAQKRDNDADLDFQVLDDIGNFKDVVSKIEEGKNIILTSPYFDNYMNKTFGLWDKLNQLLRSTDYVVEHIWFSNDPDSCIENLKRRTEHQIDSKSIIPEIPHFSKEYRITPGAQIIPVYKK